MGPAPVSSKSSSSIAAERLARERQNLRVTSARCLAYTKPMKKWLIAVCLAVAASKGLPHAAAQTDALPAPGFHHLHLNSMNPETAAAWYAKEFPSTSKTTWGGFTAL